MYNLTIAGLHTYYIHTPTTDTLVHNECGIHSRYSDGTPVYEGQQPGKITGPDPSADGPHTVLKMDDVNSRVYKAREYDVDGDPVRDIDFTGPTFPNGRIRPGHAIPEQHTYGVNDPAVGPRSGFKRGQGEPL
jgi:hypothetical protein